MKDVVGGTKYNTKYTTLVSSPVSYAPSPRLLHRRIEVKQRTSRHGTFRLTPLITDMAARYDDTQTRRLWNSL